MELELLSAILPSELLNCFSIVNFHKLCDLSTKEEIYEIHLDEKNNLPSGYETSDYESKGFLPSSRIQDFPIRGKAVYLVIRKRRWRDKETRKEISNDFSFISQGAKLTKELSDFLKGIGRDPRRYDK